MYSFKNNLKNRVSQLIKEHQDYRDLKNSLLEFFKWTETDNRTAPKILACSLKNGNLFVTTQNKAVAQEISWRQEKIRIFLKEKGWSVERITTR